MFWILFIVSLVGSLGDGRAETWLSSGDPDSLKEIVDFFNHLFISSSGPDHPVTLQVDLEDVPSQLTGALKIKLWNTLTLNDNAKISYPDSNTKLCTMDLASDGPISVESVKSGLKLKMNGCGMLLQFSVSNKTGVTIRPETVIVYGCSAELDDGTQFPWSPQLNTGLSKILLQNAQEYLTQQYNSADSFSYKYFNQSGPTLEVYQDIFNTIMILV